VIMSRKLTILLITIFSALQITASDKKEHNSTVVKYPDDGIFTGIKETNLISNPGFENRTSSWTLGKYNGGSGIFTIDTTNSLCGKQSAIVKAENHHQDYQDLQLFTFLQLSNHTMYSISFQADVKTACLISISIGNGFETLYEEIFLLRPEQKHYGPFIFQSEVDESFSYFAINLGKTHAKMKFDDLEIQADHTEREFKQVIANSGINVNYNTNNQGNSIYISSAGRSESEIPFILYDDNYNVILTNKIRNGSNEAIITLSNDLPKGKCYLKLFNLGKQELYSFLLH